MSDTASWLKSLLPFVVICFGGFMALLRHPDRRVITAIHWWRTVGGTGRDQLGADRHTLIAEIVVIPMSAG